MSSQQQQQPRPPPGGWLVAGMKKASRRIVDTGAKTMLKTDVAFLERDMKARKQRFGVEAFDIMERSDTDIDIDGPSSSSNDVQMRELYEECRMDVRTMREKIRLKKEEMGNISANSNAGESTAVGAQNNFGASHMIMTEHPGDTTEMEYGGSK